MKEVVITADSTCDLPKSIIEKNNIVITPLSILLGEDTFLDGVDVFPANVYEFVARTGTLPKTAAVAPSAYFDLFDKLRATPAVVCWSVCLFVHGGHSRCGC